MRKLITEDLEEPKKDEIYLITDRQQKVMYALSFDYNHRTESYQWTESYNSFYEWQEFAVKFSGIDFYIEPLADHDARILAEALESEPTEAEIEAAAQAIWVHEHRDFSTSIDDVVALCDESFTLPSIKAEYCERAKNALLAARKAVKSE